MSAPAGNNFNPNGRPKGAINETTRRIKQVFADLLEGKEAELNDALEKVRQTNPKAYLELYVKISERFVPQVTRAEITGQDGEPFQPVNIVLPTKPESNG
jgi:hypothetical protein